MAKRTTSYTEKGITFRSRFERDIARFLWANNVNFTYESSQYEYHVKVLGTFCENCEKSLCYKKGKYTPDFFLENGVVLEAKGLFDAADRKKMAAMKELHPELDIRMVLQYNNWLTRSKSTKYGDWCESKGILWAIGPSVPLEWLET